MEALSAWLTRIGFDPSVGSVIVAVELTLFIIGCIFALYLARYASGRESGDM
ncbi:MAG: hypothetical protein HY329_07415 [Chloroflexi bacterium]|nr:hypothetical protein [Chloroflexota bacterium]